MLDLLVLLFSFKKTKAMTAILDERQRRRREQTEDTEIHTTASQLGKAAMDNAAGGANSNSNSLQNLVESLKRKNANADLPGVGKRRKL